MKTKIFPFHLVTAIFFFMGCGGGQVNESEILAHIEETENYEALELAKMDDDLSTFVELVEMSGLDMSLEFADDFTVFVPTNKAFGEMDVERYEELTDPQNRAELAEFIKWHFLPNEVSSMRFSNTQVIETAGEEEIAVSTEMNGNVIYIGGAQIIKADIETTDGIMHIVNAVVQPTADIVPE